MLQFFFVASLVQFVFIFLFMSPLLVLLQVLFLCARRWRGPVPSHGAC